MTKDVELEKLIRTTNNLAGSLRLLDWYPINFQSQSIYFGLQDYIRMGETQGIISKGSNVLDLGSGNGISSLIWANAEYTVIGIELHPELVGVAQDAVLQASNQSLISAVPEFYTGSYFPKKYIEVRDNNKSKAIDIENNFIKECSKNKFHSGSYIERFHPVCINDVYETNNIDIKEFDILYAYVWPIQSPSIIEMFSLYARKDAKLCLINCYDSKKACQIFNLKSYDNAPFFSKL